MNSGILLVIALVAIAWAAFLQYQLVRLSKRTSVLMTGAGGKNLEELLITHMKGLKDALDEVDKVKKMNEYLDDIASRSIHKVGLVRFNPFQDTGSDQSFALALLDLNDHGVVLSSIHGREGTRIYAKPIQAGSSDHHLSKEEMDAIEQAKKMPISPTDARRPNLPQGPENEIEAPVVNPQGVDISKPEGVVPPVPPTPVLIPSAPEKPVIQKRPLGSLTPKTDIAAAVRRAEEEEAAHGQE